MCSRLLYSKLGWGEELVQVFERPWGVKYSQVPWPQANERSAVLFRESRYMEEHFPTLPSERPGGCVQAASSPVASIKYQNIK